MMIEGEQIEQFIALLVENGYEVMEKTKEKITFHHQMENRTEIFFLNTKWEEHLKKKGNYFSLKTSKEKTINHEENEWMIIYSTAHEMNNKTFEIDLMIDETFELTHRIEMIKGKKTYGLSSYTIHHYSKEELIMIKKMMDDIEECVVNESEIRLRKLFQPIEKELYFYDLIEEELAKR